MPSSSQPRRRRRRRPVVVVFWTLAWLGGTAAVTLYSVTRHAPALERLMLGEVQAAIAPLAPAGVTASVRDRDATLSGDVADEASRVALLDAADAAPGIRRVVDRLKVRPAEAPDGTGTPGEPGTPAEAPDEALAAGAPADREAPTEEPVAATATVPTARQAEAPETPAAAPAPPAGATTDTVTAGTTPPGTDTAPPLEEPGADAPRLAELPPDALASEEAPVPDAALDEPSADGPIAATPPTLSLRLEEGVLTIDGVLSPADDPDPLVDAATRSLDIDYVSNNVETREGVAMAGWLEPLAELLPALARLDAPSLRVRDDEIVLSGTAPDRATRGDIVGAALNRLGDYALVERVEIAETEATTAVVADATTSAAAGGGDARASVENGDGNAARDGEGADGDDPPRTGDAATAVATPDARASATRETRVARPVTDESTTDGSGAARTMPDEVGSDGPATDQPVPDETTPGELATKEEMTSDEPAPDQPVPDETTPGELATKEETTSDEPAPDQPVPDETTPGELATKEETTSDEPAPDETTPDGPAPGASTAAAPTPPDSPAEAASSSAGAAAGAPDDASSGETSDGASGADEQVALIDDGDADVGRDTRADSPAAALREAFTALADVRVPFYSGRDTLTRESIATLDTIAEVLRRHPGVPVAIGGHTDSFGRRDTNLVLSQLRANAVREYLVERGVERERLVARGYGEALPIADNVTAEGRAANRRIEFDF